jgi:phosphoglycerate dehydrogenase-like enzyme
VTGPAPRLLVVLKPSETTRVALNRAFPDVAWAFAEEVPPEGRAAVEALLVGSLAGGLAEFDAQSTPRLRFVQRIYTGLDGFPFSRFPPSVGVAGNVGAFAPFVAEHAVALALDALRDLSGAAAMVRAGRLRPAPDERTFLDSTVTILGYGAIGREIGRRLAGFGCRVVGVNRTGAPEPRVDRMYPAERFREALGASEVLFEARPLTRHTAGTIGRAELGRMREDAVFVNVGRAATVDPAALFDHLRAHPRFRAGFDVWWDEDYPAGKIESPWPFASLPNFYGTPHCASSLDAATPRALESAIANLARFFRQGTPLHIVDRSEYPE